MPKKDKNEISVLVNEMKDRMQELKDHKKKQLAIVTGLKQTAKQLLRKINSEYRNVLNDHNASKDVCYECVGCKWIGYDPEVNPYFIVLEIEYLRSKSDKKDLYDDSRESNYPAVRAELASLQRKLRKEFQLKVFVHLQPAHIQDDQFDPPGLY